MEWLEQNLDAYRIVAEILTQLRSTFRSDLEAIHGKEWYRTGLPKLVFDRLVDAKEKERAIDWYESEYQEIIDYAVFPDFLEILQHNWDRFPHITSLAPSSALLHARFLELEVMRSKLGRTRPISEAELAFLGTFHIRFRKAVERHHQEGPARQRDDMSPPNAVAAPAEPQSVEIEEEIVVTIDDPAEPAIDVTEEPPAPEVPVAGADTADEPASETAQLDADRHDEQRPSQGRDKEAEPESVSEDGSPAPSAAISFSKSRPRPPMRLATPIPVRGNQAAAAAKVPEPDIEPLDDEVEAARPTLAFAIDSSDTPEILRELYREVTTIAESIWTTCDPPLPLVWERVSSSLWYEKSFGTLGLKPLSDFYDIIAQVNDRLGEGFKKQQVQEYLKEANFAKILLALRDMFQKNNL
jgi:hypothetical protein